MTVTYKKNILDLDVPVLHKVVYHYIDDYEPIFFGYSFKDIEVNEWLKQNCCHGYYHSPSYMREKFIEFECDQEAMLFALRWS